MSESTEGRDQERPIRFRLEVAGELDEKWGAWFRADTLTATAGRTVVELSVADEAELHGLLRRVHDLHLRLISLTRIDDGDPSRSDRDATKERTMGTMKRSTLIVAAAVAAFAGGARAQGPLSLELRGGVALPTQQLGGTSLNTGGGFEMTAAYRVARIASVYAGWDWFQSPMAQKLGDFSDANATGYAFGVRVDGPAVGKATPWIRAGGVYNHVELEGDSYVSSKHVLGWEAGAGAAIPIGGTWSLTPGVRFRTFSPELSQLGDSPRLSYVTAEIGISVKL